MDTNELIFSLALGTIALALGAGLWQYFSVRQMPTLEGGKS